MKLSSRAYINLFHIFGVALLFYHVSTNKFVSPFIYQLFIFLGIYLLYSFRRFINIKFNNIYSFFYSVHFYIVAPLIIYIGLYKQNTNAIVLKILKYLSYFVAISHTYLLTKNIKL
jgi:hypothetical protein